MEICEQEFENSVAGLRYRNVVLPSTGEIVQMPLVSPRDNSEYAATYSASRSKLLRLLPTPEIVPIELPGDRTAVTFIAIEYVNRTIGPFNEIGICIPALIGKGKNPPMMEDLIKPNFRDLVFFTRHVIVNSRLAEVVGNELLGCNKFTSSIEFEKTLQTKTCVVSEAGEEMLRFTVNLAPEDGEFEFNRDTRTIACYKDGGLSTMTYWVATKSPKKQPTKAELNLGPHPLGQILASLDISSDPLSVRYSTDRRLAPDLGDIRFAKV